MNLVGRRRDTLTASTCAHDAPIPASACAHPGEPDSAAASAGRLQPGARAAVCEQRNGVAAVVCKWQGAGEGRGCWRRAVYVGSDFLSLPIPSYPPPRTPERNACLFGRCCRC